MRKVTTEMSHEHSSVQYEGRDTQNKQILIWGIVLFAVMIGCSLLMIPFLSSMWEWAETANPQTESRKMETTPPIILEVHPNHDLKKMQHEYQENDSATKIHAALKETAEEEI